MSTHILDDVERLCDRIGIIAGGTTVAEDAIQELASIGRDLATPEQNGADRYRLRLGDQRTDASSYGLPRGVSLLSQDGNGAPWGFLP
jgi:ABC-type multidrug transport system ATPase subunit